jgi:hypothetical protein
MFVYHLKLNRRGHSTGVDCVSLFRIINEWRLVRAFAFGDLSTISEGLVIIEKVGNSGGTK